MLDEKYIKENRDFQSPAGCPIARTFKRVYDEKRKKEVVVRDAEFNLDEFIQSVSTASDFAMLKDRCVKLGEIPSVNPNIQFGVDEVMFPDDIHELNDTLRNAQQVFDSFPAEVKAAFGNDFRNYHQSVFAGTSASIIAQYQQQQAAAAASSDTKGENE